VGAVPETQPVAGGFAELWGGLISAIELQVQHADSCLPPRVADGDSPLR